MIAACQIDRSAFRSSCCALVISFPPDEKGFNLASMSQAVLLPLLCLDRRGYQDPGLIVH